MIVEHLPHRTVLRHAKQGFFALARFDLLFPVLDIGDGVHIQQLKGHPDVNRDDSEFGQYVVLLLIDLFIVGACIDFVLDMLVPQLYDQSLHDLLEHGSIHALVDLHFQIYLDEVGGLRFYHEL